MIKDVITRLTNEPIGMEHRAGCMVVRNIEDVDRYLGLIREAAAKIHAWIAAQTGDPLDLLRRMKFKTAGFHPIQGHALNVVEQINQTWTYVVAFDRRPASAGDAQGGGGFCPGSRRPCGHRS
jgi:hypothetical protein